MPSTIRVFASHDWGEGSRNHEKVVSIVSALEKHSGMKVWIDETHMRGHIMNAMCRGIDQSDVVLVFVTDNYVRKVADGDGTDNVQREFNYASKAPRKMVTVRMESEPQKWNGPVSMVLGHELYVDLREVTPSTIEQLANAIRRRTPVTRWKDATRRVLVRKKMFGSSATLASPRQATPRHEIRAHAAPSVRSHRPAPRLPPSQNAPTFGPCPRRASVRPPRPPPRPFCATFPSECEEAKQVNPPATRPLPFFKAVDACVEWVGHDTSDDIRHGDKLEHMYLSMAGKNANPLLTKHEKLLYVEYHMGVH